MKIEPTQRSFARYGSLIFALTMGTISPAQTAPKADLETVIELSPFAVDSSEDEGYAATSSLVGSRIKTAVSPQISQRSWRRANDTRYLALPSCFLAFGA